MTKYVVLAKELIGLKGAKYQKGNIVTESCFPPNHMKFLEDKKFVEKVAKLSPKKTEEKS